MSIIFNPVSSSALISLWSKYRPAIVHLMLAAGEGPQKYKMYGHEFKALAAKDKNFSFVMQAHRGKAVNNIKKSPAAQDLLAMLNTSPKAMEQLEKYSFEYRLDSQFVLHISRVQPAVVEPVAEQE